jgi:hypothetical protein
MMRRLTTFLVLGVVCGILVAGSAWGRKKKAEEGPVLERFEATIAGGGADTLEVSIQTYSTPDEMQSLAQTYARGGESALADALHKTKDGYFHEEHGDTMPLKVVEQTSEGGGRRLSIIGEAPTGFEYSRAGSIGQNPFGGTVMVGHRGYEYTAIQLDVDAQGNGTGMIVFYCKLAFNKDGHIAVQPMAGMNGNTTGGVEKLVKVHLVK